MQSFKKAILSTLAVFLIVLLGSVGIIEILMNSEYYHCCDKRNIESQSGKIDLIVSGSSNAMNAFIPRMLDERLQLNSYNLCGPAMESHAKYLLLKQTAKDNDIAIAVLDMNYDDMSLSPGAVEGNMYAIPRINSFFDRVSFFFTVVDGDAMEPLIGNYLYDGSYVAFSRAFGESSILGTIGDKSNVDYSAKGFREGMYPENKKSIAFSESDIISHYNTSQINLFGKNFERNDKYVKEYITYCKENNIRCIISVTPFSDSHIWIYDNWDDYKTYLENLSEEYGCEFYDFNLLKNRYMLFSDSSTFVDGTHLNRAGAEKFTPQFCEIINSVDSGKDVSDLFYSSYEEMKKDSPYMKYYLTHKNDK